MRGFRDNAASVLRRVEDGSQEPESRPDVPKFDPKAPEGAHLFSVRKFIKPSRRVYAEVSDIARIITERCRAYSDSFAPRVEASPGLN